MLIFHGVILLKYQASGIVEFTPKFDRSKQSLTIGQTFESIPVLNTYKYLGMMVDRELSLTPQLKHIADKAAFLQLKLWPVLRNISLDYRVNLWTLLIRPLFEMSIAIHTIKCRSEQERVQTLARKTFKKFKLIKKNLKNKTVERLMDFGFAHRVQQVTASTKLKWQARRRNEIAQTPRTAKLTDSPVPKAKAVYPSELQTFLNLTLALCPKCTLNTPCSPTHMLQTHSTYIPEHDIVLDKLQDITEKSRQLYYSRRRTLKEGSEFLKPFINCLHHHLGTYGNLQNPKY